jgi:hypothetical protein
LGLQQGIEGLKRGTEARIVQPGGSTTTTAPLSSGSGASTINSDREWHGDRPPREWPTFSPDDPLSIRYAANISDRQAIDLAMDIEDRWNSGQRPSASEILNAQRALLMISDQNPRFPVAWASFVKLQQMRREAA